MKCSICGKQVLMVQNDSGACIDCHKPFTSAPRKHGRNGKERTRKKRRLEPITDMKEYQRIYQRQYRKKNRVKLNKLNTYYKEQKRKKEFAEKLGVSYEECYSKHYIVNQAGLYRQPREYKKNKWGKIATAKMYQTLPRAKYSIKMFGEGVAIQCIKAHKIESQKQVTKGKA